MTLVFEEEGVDELDTSYDLSKSKYVDLIRVYVLECMDHFFCDKTYWAGGSIAKSKLYREEHIRTVMEMNIMDAYAIAYHCLEHNPPDTININEQGWDIKLCYGVVCQCRDRFIPKPHIGGMLLVYLSICHGVDYIPTMRMIAEIRSMLLKQEKQKELEELIREQQEDSDEE